MEDCLFCKIVAGEIPCSKVYEDENTVAFLDINPASKGHTILVPKNHSEDIELMDQVDYYELVKVVPNLRNKLTETLKVDRVLIIVDGSEIKHTHIHFIPANKGSGTIKVSKYTYKDGEVEELLKKLS